MQLIEKMKFPLIKNFADMDFYINKTPSRVKIEEIPIVEIQIHFSNRKIQLITFG